jgi:hypothetical protein
MSYQNISASIAAADKTTVQSSIQTIKGKLPFLIAITPAERKKLRKMGSVRTAYVQDVYIAAANNTGAIPPALSMTEYGKDVQLMKDLTDIVSWLLPVYEGIQDTCLALGNELMKQSDEAYGYLKNAAKKNSSQALSMTVKQISDQLKTGKRVASNVPPVK